jgi:hypothetical protein
MPRLESDQDPHPRFHFHDEGLPTEVAHEHLVRRGHTHAHDDVRAESATGYEPMENPFIPHALVSLTRREVGPRGRVLWQAVCSCGLLLDGVRRGLAEEYWRRHRQRLFGNSENTEPSTSAPNPLPDDLRRAREATVAMPCARYRLSGKVHRLTRPGELVVRCLPGGGRPVHAELWDLTEDAVTCRRCQGERVRDPSDHDDAYPVIGHRTIVAIEPLEGGSLGFGMPDPPNDWYSVLYDAVNWHNEHRREASDPDDVSDTIAPSSPEQLRNDDMLAFAFTMLDGWIQRTGKLPGVWGGEPPDPRFRIRWDPQRGII